MASFTIIINRFFLKKSLVVSLLWFYGIYYCYYLFQYTNTNTTISNEIMSLRDHWVTVAKFYSYRYFLPSSQLGHILFARGGYLYPNNNPYNNRTFVVLVWKHWESLKIRYQYNDGNTQCSVNNCLFSGDESKIDVADAVLVDLQKGHIPEVKERELNQRWIFLYEESPITLLSHFPKNTTWEKFENIFNWSMTYRFDADVPIPYGRTIPRDKPAGSDLDIETVSKLIPNWNKKRRDVLVAVYLTDCNMAIDFLKKLMTFVEVHVYGDCPDSNVFTNRCSNQNECQISDAYFFYLVLQNSDCVHFLNEEVFYHAYNKGAIPIIWGPSDKDVEILLPPNSYLHVDRKTNIKLLGEDIKTIASMNQLILSMHLWRINFEVVNEHGYFGTKSYHLCRLCEALNYNDAVPKFYQSEDLNRFLNPSIACDLKKYYKEI